MYFDGMNFVENTVENCAKSLPDENTCIECEMNYMPDADPITACNCMYDTDFCKIPLDKLPDGKVCEFGTFK